MLIEKGNEMTEFERKCYGMTTEDIREEYMNGLTARISGLEMIVMGILSDAQELLSMDIASGNPERVRKQLNIAKFILCEMNEAREAA